MCPRNAKHFYEIGKKVCGVRSQCSLSPTKITKMKVLWIEGYRNLRTSIEAILPRHGHEVDFYLPRSFREREGNLDIPTFGNAEDLAELLNCRGYDLLVVNREDFIHNGSDTSPSEFAEYIRDVRNLDYNGTVRATFNCIQSDVVAEEIRSAGLVGLNLFFYEKHTLNSVDVVEKEEGVILA